MKEEIGAMKEEIGAMKISVTAVSTKMEKIELFQLQEYGVISYS